MTNDEYHAASGLSNSGMRDLEVSPLRFWHTNLNPNRQPEEETPFMQFGSAVHCAVLEPKEFDRRYACEFIAPEGCLVTMDDLRGWLRENGIQPKGTKKAEAIAQVQACGTPPIFDVLQSAYLDEHSGKTIFKADDWHRVAGAASALLDEPKIQDILKQGEAEVPIFVKDTDTGVALKGKLDWINLRTTLDIKTFSQKRGSSIDKSVHDAIYYEKYYRQAYIYYRLRELRGDGDTTFVMAFVESEEPHEVRICSLRPKTGPQPNLFWTRAMIEVRGFLHQYKECMEHFGPDKPWRYAQTVQLLADEDIKQLAY